MTTYVLVPGAWLGGWVWEPVATLLRERGHAVHPLTLPGLSDRSTGAAEVGLEDHVEDVVTVLEDRDLRDVVLVGHSYAGLVAGIVADRAPDRVAHTVFLDANVPVDGASMVDGWSAAGQELVRASIAGHDGLWPAPEPEDFAGHDLTDEQVADLLARSTGHPGRTLLEPAGLTRPLEQLSATFVACTLPDGPEQRPHVEALRDAWDFVELETGHWPMVSTPEQLVEVLDQLGR
ncbi:MAG: alpha/beta fold hydrolase [Oryzihumus sp.]